MVYTVWEKIVAFVCSHATHEIISPVNNQDAAVSSSMSPADCPHHAVWVGTANGVLALSLQYGELLMHVCVCVCVHVHSFGAEVGLWLGGFTETQFHCCKLEL